MKKLLLTTAALLVAAGSAFAESDNWDPTKNNGPAYLTDRANPGVDRSTTASIRDRAPVVVHRDGSGQAIPQALLPYGSDTPSGQSDN